MSIASSIAALAPNLWYKLDETSGSTAANSGSLANNGTYSGDYAIVTGPEVDTTAIRLFASGMIRSNAGMDVTTLGAYSIGLWVSNDASGSVGVAYPIVRVGDPTNYTTRGFNLQESHSVVGTTNYGFRWTPSGFVTGSALTDVRFWHWVVVTFTTGTNNQKMYIDGILKSQSTIGTHTACLSTDPLTIACDEPTTVAHVCFWQRVLTLVEIESVADELAPWPYTVPINTPPAGGDGGGGLTEAQATQLAEIDTKTDSLPTLVTESGLILAAVEAIEGKVDALGTAVADVDGKVVEALGHLNTLLEVTAEQTIPLLNDIKDAVTRIFITGAGLGLGTPIGSLLAHPDPNLLHAANEEFVISGQGTLTPPGPLGYGNVYGIRWTATTVPSGAGFRDGIIPSYTQRLVQWVLWYPDVGDLELYAQEVAEFRLRQYTWLWERPFPNTIQYDVLPGFELTCRFILLAPITPP